MPSTKRKTVLVAELPTVGNQRPAGGSRRTALSKGIHEQSAGRRVRFRAEVYPLRQDASLAGIPRNRLLYRPVVQIVVEKRLQGHAFGGADQRGEVPCHKGLRRPDESVGHGGVALRDKRLCGGYARPVLHGVQFHSGLVDGRVPQSGYRLGKADPHYRGRTEKPEKFARIEALQPFSNAGRFFSTRRKNRRAA